MEENNSTSLAIKKARLSSDQSQKELAKKLGVSDKTISAYETGRAVPPTVTLTQIANATKVPINTLLGISNVPDEINIKQKLEDIERQISYLGPNIQMISNLRMDAFVGIVLRDIKDNIYLIKENDKYHISKNRWNLPGGSVDQNEDFIQAAVREMLEKTGYKVNIKSLLGCYKCVKDNSSWVYIVFEAVAYKKISQPLDSDVKTGKWFTRQEFLKLKKFQIVHEDMKLVYKNAIENQGLNVESVKYIDYDKQ